MMLGLRKIEGVNKDGFFKKFGKNIEEVFNIEELIPIDKMYLQNSILVNFIKSD